MVFFLGILENDGFLVFCTEQNKIPIVENKTLVGYNLVHHLKVIDFCQIESETTDIIEKYLKNIKKYPETFIENDDSNVRSRNKQITENFRIVGKFYFPFADAIEYLSQKQSELSHFDIEKKRWILDLKLTEEELKSYKKSLSLITGLSSKAAGTAFMEILNKIPKFSLKLTEEQSDSVKKSGHVVILGRSGTGKTTSAVLRMFASEILYKYKIRSKSQPFSPKDVQKVTPLHCIFVTASPVLTHEVKRFYNKIKDHLCEQLQENLEKKKKFEDLQDLIEEDDKDSLDCEYSESDDEENGPFSMHALKDHHFPMFFTFRRLVLMIDASIRYPFFPRDLHGRIIGMGSGSDWTNEYVNSMKISKSNKPQVIVESESDDDDDEDMTEQSMQTEEILKKSEKIRQQRTTIRSFEVDYKVFKEKFWPTIKKKTNYSPLVLWTEITAYIKGASNAWMYIGGYLPKYTYSDRYAKQSLLTKSQRLEIWDLFYDYEKWKKQYHAYDFQDVVNYILSYVKYNGYSGVPIHYMMVDEVQDLTNASIALLISVCKEKIVFSGDTAQTIAQGVGFRFSDLGNLFQECGLEIPFIDKLTINFRTHNQILALANSVVGLLETLFPQTIDSMVKETSYKDGPVPIIIPSGNIDELIKIVFGINSKEKDEIQFGCNQVIIVRNQESKSHIPTYLSHALCLTVFESKGLEFDDVILFNFFTDSDVSLEKWKVLQNVVKVDDFHQITDEEDLENEKKIEKFRCWKDFNSSKHAVLCTELKHLYVSITRPKKNLIIFDESPEKRRFIQDFWDGLGIINFSEGQSGKDQKIEKILEISDLNAWRVQGERMMAHKFYDQASKCFKVCKEALLERKALAFQKATNANAIISKSKSQLYEMKSSDYEKKNQRKRVLKIKLKQNIKNAENMFKEAAEEMMEIFHESQQKGLLKHAAQCFASGKEYLKAAELFEKTGFVGQAAESFWQAEEFERAGELFDERGDYARAIDSFSKILNWDRIIRCLFKNKERIPKDELQKYVYKFMPAALEDAIPKVLPGETGGFIKRILEEQNDVIQEASDEDEDL
jgi:tetratricopeptide (TPR) repeat protein